MKKLMILLLVLIALPTLVFSQRRQQKRNKQPVRYTRANTPTPFPLYREKKRSKQIVRYQYTEAYSPLRRTSVTPWPYDASTVHYSRQPVRSVDYILDNNLTDFDYYPQAVRRLDYDVTSEYYPPRPVQTLDYGLGISWGTTTPYWPEYPSYYNNQYNWYNPRGSAVVIQIPIKIGTKSAHRRW